MWPWIILIVAGVILFRGSTAGIGHTRVPQLPGSAGIVQTVSLMRSMVNQAIDNPLIRDAAVQATSGIDRNNQKGQAVAIGEWIRRTMRYVPDPRHLEQLTNPVTYMLRWQKGQKLYGDCDDMAMLAAAMGKSIGLRAIFKAVGRGAQYHHVYVVLAGITIDATVAFGKPPFKPGRELTLEV